MMLACHGFSGEAFFTMFDEKTHQGRPHLEGPVFGRVLCRIFEVVNWQVLPF